MSLIKTDRFAQLLAEYSGVTEEEALSFIKSFSNVVSQKVKQGEDVDVQGLGRFILIDTKQAEMRRIALMLADSMKDEVNSPFSFFEPYTISKGKYEFTEDENTKEEDKITESVVVIDENSLSTTDAVDTAKAEDTKTPISDSLVESSDESTDTVESITTKVEEDITISVDESIINNQTVSTKEKGKIWIIALLLITVVLLVIIYLFLHKPVSSIVSAEELSTTIVADYNINSEPTIVDSLSSQSDSICVTDESLQQQEKTNDIKNDLQNQHQKPEVNKNKLQSEVLISDPHIVNRRLVDSIGNPVIVILQSGERLTLVSLKYFGSKDFWPYVFDVNSDRLKSPSNVQTGMKLYLPDPEFFNIDANSEESLEKAKKRGIELLNK